jgi:hypothetical protein
MHQGERAVTPRFQGRRQGQDQATPPGAGLAPGDKVGTPE